MNHKNFQIKNFKALDAEQGIFEAIVAVFNNVDRINDKIIPGAFLRSLAAWKAKGRPIPVIFAHEWDNLDAHIGQVLEAKEVEEGLYVKGQLEMDEPFAKRVWKKMQQGVLAEFSFAYDTVKEAIVDGVRELREVDLLEVGPCLVGMNPETRLIGVKESELKPYPNEHACRLRDPDDFEEGSFRRTTREHEGKEYSIILGRLKDEETLTEQAYRYAKKVWSADEAKAHCRAHDGAFEAAAEKSGARHTAKEFEMIQGIHDLAVSLGAKCAGAEDNAAGDEAEGDDEAREGKSRGREASMTATKLDLDLLELE